MTLQCRNTILNAILALSLSGGAAFAADCTPTWKPLRDARVISTSELVNLQHPGPGGDTTYIGVVSNPSRPSLRVQFGYIHPQFPKELQDPHAGTMGQCVEFHFAQNAVEGGASLGAKIEDWSDGDEATITIWRK